MSKNRQSNPEPQTVPRMTRGQIESLRASLPRIRRDHEGPWHHCRDCDKWYGAEDDEYGPCMYKHLRKDEQYLTPGAHECDEPQELRARGLL